MKLASALYTGVHPFNKFGLFTDHKTVYHPDELDGTDALVIWGGSDIHPSLYNDVNTHSHVASTPSKRDEAEWALLHGAIERGIPIIGVCRGGQMLCAAAGGKLYQHVNSHASGAHEVETDDGKVIQVSSLHHQMMNPEGTEHSLVMWSKHKRSLKYFDARGEHTDTTVGVEPEYIYFPKIKGHAIQWHPEFHEAGEACNIWLKDRWKNGL